MSVKKKTFLQRLKLLILEEELEEKIPPEAALLKEAEEVKKALMRAYGNFNEYLSPEMTDYGIYEIKALETKYSYLLREIKRLEMPGA